MRNIKRLACMGEGKRVSDGERRDCELQRQKMPFETNSICLVSGVGGKLYLNSSTSTHCSGESGK